jgi:glycerol-3-phosphate dehydrogenase
MPEVARIVAEELGKSSQWQADEAVRFDDFARTWML